MLYYDQNKKVFEGMSGYNAIANLFINSCSVCHGRGKPPCFSAKLMVISATRPLMYCSYHTDYDSKHTKRMSNKLLFADKTTLYVFGITVRD